VHINRGGQCYTYFNKDDPESMENKLLCLSLVKHYKEVEPDKDLKICFFLTDTVMNNKGTNNWKETQAILERWKSEYGITYETMRIEDEDDENVSDDLKRSQMAAEMIKRMMDVLSPGDDVVLDITNAFRDLTVIASVIAMYFKEALGVNIEIKYGKFVRSTNGGGNGDTCSNTYCKDVSFVTELAEWLYAARLFKNYGYGVELGKLITKRNGEYWSRQSKEMPDNCNEETTSKRNVPTEKPNLLSGLKGKFSDLSYALRIGAIKELDETVRKFLKSFDMPKGEDTTKTLLEEIGEYVPELDLLIEDILERYRKLSTADGELTLSEDELQRERNLIQFYVDTDDMGAAVRLAREYSINVILFKQGMSDKFLEEDAREKNAHLINPVIRDTRNHVSHFGFNKDNASKKNKVNKELTDIFSRSTEAEYDELMKNKKNFENSDVAVVSGLGKSGGPLYTILNKYHPNLLVVVTSNEVKSRLDRIVKAANFKHEPKIVLIKDVRSGTDEINSVIDEVKRCLGDVKNVVVNITGGTTLMNYTILKAVSKIRHGRNVKTVLTYDKRSDEEKKEEKESGEENLVIGEVVELD